MAVRLVAGRRCVARALAMPRDIRRMTIRLLMHIRHRRDEQCYQQNHATRKRPAAVRLRWDVPFGVFDHSVPRRACRETIGEYTNQLALDQPWRATGTPSSGFGKKGSK